MVRRKLCSVDQGIMKLAHDRVRLPVFEPGGETGLSVGERDRQFQADLQRVPFADQASVADPHRSVRLADSRRLVRGADFDLLPLLRVVIQAPQARSSGIVRPGREVAQGQQGAVFSDHDGGLFILEASPVG